MDLRSLEPVLAYECGLQKEAPLVVGVSGGPDSLCLLHALYSLGYAIVAVHVNHQLRPEADLEATAVKQFAEGLKIPFIQTRVDVRGFADVHKLSTEESARILRYRFLFATAQEQHAQAVAVAHQADDQIETVLMHLLRGSGLSGLKGMPYRGTLPVFSTSLSIVRPLMGVWREEIIEYCQQNEISPCYDASNEDTRYFRNRIRTELVPLLKTYNDQAPRHLWQLASLVGAEDAYLLEQTRRASEQVNARSGEGYILFEMDDFNNLHLALQRRLLRGWLAELQENIRDIGAEAVQRAFDFLSRQNPTATCQVLDGVWLSRFTGNTRVIYRSDATFEREFPLISPGEQLSFAIPGTTRLNPHWEFLADWIEPSQMDLSQDDWTAYLDVAEKTEALRFTTGDTAERITYLSKQEHRIKLGDLLTDKKVFSAVRSTWPVLRAGQQILWVPGLKRSNQALVTEQTRRVLRLQLRKK
ncbi:MAG: tRNA lysidine(34) synthetase TilS [Anaerolineaceae bacterium]|nr:tRNA lysidine(34) synthetase TilS [Anaerolineaceae bacterium]